MSSTALTDLPDDELVKRCQLELPYETSAFTELVERHKGMVYSKAKYMLRHSQDAEDATQEIFIRVFNGLPQFKQNAAFKTWLTAIASNTCLSVIDKRQRKPWWWLSQELDETLATQKTDVTMFIMASKQLEDEDQKQQIEKAMSQLPEADREILRLRFWEELDYQSIADRLSVKLSASKMRLKRAKEKFQQVYSLASKEDVT